MAKSSDEDAHINVCIVLITVSNDFANYFLEKAKIMRRYEAHRRFKLLCIGNAGENRHHDNAPVTTPIGHHSYMSIK